MSHPASHHVIWEDGVPRRARTQDKLRKTLSKAQRAERALAESCREYAERVRQREVEEAMAMAEKYLRPAREAVQAAPSHMEFDSPPAKPKPRSKRTPEEQREALRTRWAKKAHKRPSMSFRRELFNRLTDAAKAAGVNRTEYTERVLRAHLDALTDDLKAAAQ